MSLYLPISAGGVKVVTGRRMAALNASGTLCFSQYYYRILPKKSCFTYPNSFYQGVIPELFKLIPFIFGEI
jgi:hypothetical protein